MADKRGVPLEEIENTPELLVEAETQLETEGQAEVEGSRDVETLAEPQSEGLPLMVRATLPVALAKEEAEIDAVGDAAMLPDESALPVGSIPDAVTLVVKLRLDEEQAEGVRVVTVYLRASLDTLRSRTSESRRGGARWRALPETLAAYEALAPTWCQHVVDAEQRAECVAADVALIVQRERRG